MSGHSKWSTIKRQKGVADAKRATVFTKLSNSISLAVKQGGGTTDPSLNYKLRLAIDAAKGANMPKDNIQRAIQKAAGPSGSQMDEVVYEGFGPNGIAIIVEGVTDNKLRTNSEIKNIFDKRGGSFGSSGSVSYLFELMGMIIIEKNDKTYDEIFLSAAEFGAKDTQEDDEYAYVFTDPDKLYQVKEQFETGNFSVKEASLIRKAINTLEIEGDKRTQVEEFISSLEDHQDVTSVYTNLD